MLVPINHGIGGIIASLSIAHSAGEGLDLPGREIVSLLERLATCSFTGNFRFPRRLWSGLGLIAGIEVRGFPHIIPDCLDLSARTLNTDLWPEDKDGKPVTFMHLSSIHFHYGFQIWNQVRMHAKLEWYMRENKGRINYAEQRMIVKQIVFEQLIPDLNRAMHQSWEQEHRQQAKAFGDFVTKTNLELEGWGLEPLEEVSSEEDDRQGLTIFWTEEREPLDWVREESIEQGLETARGARERFMSEDLRMKEQRRLLKRLSHNALPLATFEEDYKPCDTLKLEFLWRLGDAFYGIGADEENVESRLLSYVPRIELEQYATLISGVAFSSAELPLSTLVPHNQHDLTESLLFSKVMAWPGSLRQVVRFNCQTKDNSKGDGWTLQLLADILTDCFKAAGMQFTLGSYNNGKLTGKRVMQLQIGGPGLAKASMIGYSASDTPNTQTHDAQFPTATGISPMQMLQLVEKRFDIDLRTNSLPREFEEGRKDLLADLRNNSSDASQALGNRVNRILTALDTRDARHHYLLVTGQMLFLHRPPPKVMMEDKGSFSFKKGQGSRNTRWLAAYVMLGLSQMYRQSFITDTMPGEGSGSAIADKANRYQITGRLLLATGCYRDDGRAGRSKSFSDWKFIDLEEANQKMNTLRSRAKEGPMDLLTYIWPENNAKDIIGQI